MTLSYCVEWNHLLHKPIDPLTEEQARARHDAGEQYAAVIDRQGQPRHVVTLHLEFDSVMLIGSLVEAPPGARAGPHASRSTC